MMNIRKYTPCDDGRCPYEATGSYDCLNNCGAAADVDSAEDFEDLLREELDYDIDYELVCLDDEDAIDAKIRQRLASRRPLDYDNDRDFEINELIYW